MVTLAEEMPLAAVVTDNIQVQTHVCSNCFKYESKREWAHCAGCEFTRYCSRECQKEDWRTFHKYECQFVTKGCMDQRCRLMLRIAVAILSIEAKPAFNGKKWDQLETHHVELLASESHRELYVQHVNALHDFIIMNRLPEGLVLEIFCKMCINGVAILADQGAELGSGLYIGLSVHDHSCNPDAYAIFRGKRAVLRSLNTALTYSPKLTTAYIEPLQLSEDRRRILKGEAFFECNCDRCQDKDWDAWGRALVCNHCDNGCCPRYADDIPPVCVKCGKTSSITEKEIQEAFETSSSTSHLLQAEDFQTVLKTELGTYERVKNVFHANSFIVMNIMHCLVELGELVEEHDIVREYSIRLLSSARHYLQPGYTGFATTLFKTSVRLATAKNAPTEKELMLLEQYFNPNGITPVHCTKEEFEKAVNADVDKIKNSNDRARRYVELLLEQARQSLTLAYGEDSVTLKELDEAKFGW